jgi:hypothetical protein
MIARVMKVYTCMKGFHAAGMQLSVPEGPLSVTWTGYHHRHSHQSLQPGRPSACFPMVPKSPQSTVVGHLEERKQTDQGPFSPINWPPHFSTSRLSPSRRGKYGVSHIASHTETHLLEVLTYYHTHHDVAAIIIQGQPTHTKPYYYY